MSPKISTPVEGFSGTVVGVHFERGEGETEDPRALAYFERQGYTIHPASTAATGKESGTKSVTPKQKAQAEATELGLSSEGTQTEIEKRIADHKQTLAKAQEDGAITDGSENAGSGNSEGSSEDGAGGDSTEKPGDAATGSAD